jgi:uncharacterized protein YciI
MRLPTNLTTGIVLTIGIATAFGLNGCAAQPSAPLSDYTLVYLKTGPSAKDKSPGERTAIQADHLANIKRLAEEGSLVVAGPFGTINHDPTQRGIFVFDVASIEEARALTNTDPAVKAGVLILEPHTFRSDANLSAIVKTDLAMEKRAKREGRPYTMEERLRSFVMLRTDDADDTDLVLAKVLPPVQILIAARVDGKHGFYIIDATDVEKVRAALEPESAALGAFTVDEWLATKQVTAAREH